MKKLNTHTIYTFALRVNPLTTLEHKDSMTLQDVFWPLFRAELSLRSQLEAQGFFSPSLKRSAGALLRAIYDAGIKEGDPFDTDMNAAVQGFRLNVVVNRAKEFETVLANELPGLATYIVYQKGIYSTDELISEADRHVPESLREALPAKAKEDIRQSGRCLAFEVGTASAFHMWRAVESVMDCYHEALTGKTFDRQGVNRGWFKYIEALVEAAAETKITKFLDHIREEYRNPVSHPEETVELDEAFQLFAAGMSAIGQMLRPISEIRDKKAAEEKDKADAAASVPMFASAGYTSLAALAGLASNAASPAPAPLVLTPSPDKPA